MKETAHNKNATFFKKKEGKNASYNFLLAE